MRRCLSFTPWGSRFGSFHCGCHPTQGVNKASHTPRHTQSLSHIHTFINTPSNIRRGVPPTLGLSSLDTCPHARSCMGTGARMLSQPRRSKHGSFTEQGCPPAPLREPGRQQASPCPCRGEGTAPLPPHLTAGLQVTFPSGPASPSLPGSEARPVPRFGRGQCSPPPPGPFLLLGPGPLSLTPSLIPGSGPYHPAQDIPESGKPGLHWPGEKRRGPGSISSPRGQ